MPTWEYPSDKEHLDFMSFIVPTAESAKYEKLLNLVQSAGKVNAYTNDLRAIYHAKLESVSQRRDLSSMLHISLMTSKNLEPGLFTSGWPGHWQNKRCEKVLGKCGYREMHRENDELFLSYNPRRISKLY